jgi:hypothetical protein
MEKIILRYDVGANNIGKEYHDKHISLNYLLKYKHILKQDQILFVEFTSKNTWLEFYPNNDVIVKFYNEPSKTINISNLYSFINTIKFYEQNKILNHSCKHELLIACVMSVLVAISDGYLNIYAEPINRQERRNIKKQTDINTAEIYKICIIKANVFKNINNIPTHIKQKEHTRRGHYRHYKNGKTIFINSYTAGNKNLGTIKKEYQI